MKSAAYSIVACAMVLIAFAGCGKSVSPGEPVAATGVVTLDGAPLSNVTVGFTAITEGIPAKYRYTSATTEPDGTFSLEKIYPAEYMVTLNDSEAAAPEGGEGKVEAVAGNPKLAKYANDSPLRAKVSDPDQSFKFEATSAPDA